MTIKDAITTLKTALALLDSSNANKVEAAKRLIRDVVAGLTSRHHK